MNPDHGLDRVGERTALLLAGAAAGALFCAWAYRRRSLSGDFTSAHSEATTPRTQHAAGLTVAADALQDDILREQFTRNIQFFGEAAQAKVFGSFVVIVGLGVCAPLLMVCHALASADLILRLSLRAWVAMLLQCC